MDEWKARYIFAHQGHQQRETPNAVRDHGFLKTQFPDVRTAGGLQQFIIKYLDWSGYYGNRINTVGRKIEQKIRTASGKIVVQEKWIKGTTKKGTGDVSAIVRGMHVTWEVKIGRDTVKPDQLKEKARIERAGGYYYFVRTPEEFLEQLDSIARR